MIDKPLPIRSTLMALLRDLTVSKAFYPVQIAVSVGAAASWAFAPSATGWWWKVVLALVGAFLVALQINMGRLRAKWIAEYEQLTARELIAMLDSYYVPLLRRVTHCASTRPGNGDAIARVEQGALTAAHNICGPRGVEGVRAVLFEANRGTLKPKFYVGGARPTKRTFTRSKAHSPADVEAWKTAETGEPRTYPDLDKKPPVGFKLGKSPYKTFSTCGILDSCDRVVGMLNVDAPTAGSLSKVDETVLRLLCETLSVAYDVNKEAPSE